MTGNKQQQTHAKELKAGIPLNIDQPCEFIFIDQGENLDFVVGNSRLSGRKAGDFARFDVPVESVQVTSQSDQTIKLVLGFGEFSRLIVSGELNVSSFVETLRGQSASLPYDLTKRVGLVDGISVNVEDAGEDLSNGLLGNMDNSDEPAGFYYDGNFYKLHATGLFKANADFQGYTQIPFNSVDATAVSHDWANAGCDQAGNVYFMCRENGTGAVYVYTFNMATLDVVQLTDLVSVDNGSTGWSLKQSKGGVYEGNYYFWIDGNHATATNKNRLFRMNLSTFEYEYIQLKGHSYNFSDIDLGLFGWIDHEGLFCIGLDQGGTPGATKNNYARFDLAGNFVDTGRLLFSINAVLCVVISPDGRHAFTVRNGISGTDEIHYRISQTTYGTLFAQNGDDMATRQTMVLTAPLSAVPVAGGYLVTAGLVPALLGMLRGDFEPYAGEYLDYLTGIAFTDQNGTERRYSSGTKTLHGRGISDEGMPIVIEGDVTLSLLPELFDQ